MVIPSSRRRARARARPTRERAAVRWLFYTVLLALLLLTFFVLPYLYEIGIIGMPALLAQDTITLSLSFPMIAFSYLLAKGRTLKAAVGELGLSRRKLTMRYVALGVVLFIVFFIMQIGVGVFSAVTGIQINSNVSTTLAGLPLYFYFFTFLVAPINEEILFRGFMVPRFGIVISALIFGALHYLSYYSWIEFVAAFAFGLAAGYVFKKTESLYPSIVGHVLFDFVNILILFFL